MDHKKKMPFNTAKFIAQGRTMKETKRILYGVNKQGIVE